MDARRQTLEEKETNIHFDETNGLAWVETHNTALRNQLKKRSEEYPDQCILKTEDTARGYVRYYLPKRWIKISPPRKVTMTEERKQALREASEKGRKKIRAMKEKSA